MSIPEITAEDIAENILAPEIESALYALIVNSGPIRYDDAGLARIHNAARKVFDGMSLGDLDGLRARADDEIKKLFGEDR